LERKVLGYILILVSLLLAISACIISHDILTLHLELGILNPDLPDEAKLFHARFLYSVSPAYLDDYAEWKDAAREKIAKDQLEFLSLTDNEPKTKEEIIKEIADSEKYQDRIAASDENQAWIILLMLLSIGLGMHFIAQSVTTPSSDIIRVAYQSHVLNVPFGIMVVLVFLLTNFIGLLGVANPIMVYIGPLFGEAILLAFIIRHIASKGSSFLSEAGFISGDYRKAILVGVAGFFAFLPVMLILNTQGMLMSYSLGIVPDGHPFVREFIETQSLQIQIIILVLVLLSAPFIEEVFFRGLFLQSLEQRFKPAVACIFTGIIFGIIHPGFVSKFLITFLGIYLAFLMQKTRSIITPIVVHFMFNAYALSQLLIK